jgi:anti-sigma regulatory factor (Ser/Thr protein kinase)
VRRTSPTSCGEPGPSGSSVQQIELTIPREREFSAVADIVLAGLASRLDLTLETIDDLQLALESLLEHDEGEGHVTVRFGLGEGAIHASVGPFDRERIEPELAAVGAGTGIGLGRLLETTVDSVTLAEREGACWVELRKEIPTGAA